MTPTTPSPAPAARATLSIALSACGFSAIAIFITLATDAGAPLLSVLAWRYVIAAFLLTAIGWFTGGYRFEPFGVKVMALAGLGQSLIAVVSLSALRYVPAGTLAFLFYTYPAMVAVIAHVRHSEPLTPARLGALGLSLAGIAVMVGTAARPTLHPMGVGLALAAALLYAVYIPMINGMQRRLTPLSTTTYVTIGAAIILSSAAAARGEFTADLHNRAWLSILALSLVSTIGAFLFFLRGLAVLGPVRTAIISTVEPFFTALLGAMVLGQPLTATTLVGGALIAAAVVLLQVRPAGNGQRTTESDRRAPNVALDPNP